MHGTGLVAEVTYQRCALLHQIHGPVGGVLGHLHHVGETIGGIADLGDLFAGHAARIDLEVDDGIVQLAGQLADFLVKTPVTQLIELIDNMHGLGEIAAFQAFHQLLGVLF